MRRTILLIAVVLSLAIPRSDGFQPQLLLPPTATSPNAIAAMTPANSEPRRRRDTGPLSYSKSDDDWSSGPKNKAELTARALLTTRLEMQRKELTQIRAAKEERRKLMAHRSLLESRLEMQRKKRLRHLEEMKRRAAEERKILTARALLESRLELERKRRAEERRRAVEERKKLTARALLAARLELERKERLEEEDARRAADEEDGRAESELKEAESEAEAEDEEARIGDASDDLDASALYASLHSRLTQLQNQKLAVRNRWLNAKCQSSVRLAASDWIRRLDLKRWPVGVVGTAGGSVCVVDLEKGQIVASPSGGIGRTREDNIQDEQQDKQQEQQKKEEENAEVHSPIGGNPNLNVYLHGPHDGGGTLAVCIKGDSVISAGREGGAKAWRYDSKAGQLVYLGNLNKLDGRMVTSLEIDAEYKLWVGVYDGTYAGSVCHYDLLDPAPLSEQVPLEVKVPTGVLSLAVSDESGLVAAGTAGGTVEVISMDRGELVGSWDYNGDGTKTTHARSVEIFQAGVSSDDDFSSGEEDGSSENSDGSWCVVAGGGDGTLKMRWLSSSPTSSTDGGHASSSSVINLDQPFDATKLPLVMPPHSAMVVSLTSCRQNGLLISGSQDGTMRVWDFCDESTLDAEASDYSSEFDAGSGDDMPNVVDVHPVVLYQLAGYKVWLGSVKVDEDGLRIISDGADNTVVVHDFSHPAGEKEEEGEEESA